MDELSRTVLPLQVAVMLATPLGLRSCGAVGPNILAAQDIGDPSTNAFPASPPPRHDLRRPFSASVGVGSERFPAYSARLRNAHANAASEPASGHSITICVDERPSQGLSTSPPNDWPANQSGGTAMSWNLTPKIERPPRPLHPAVPKTPIPRPPQPPKPRKPPDTPSDRWVWKK